MVHFPSFSLFASPNVIFHSTLPVAAGVKPARAISPSSLTSPPCRRMSPIAGNNLGNANHQFVAIADDDFAASFQRLAVPGHRDDVRTALADVPAGRNDLRPVEFLADGICPSLFRLAGRRLEAVPSDSQILLRPELVHEVFLRRIEAEVGERNSHGRKRFVGPIHPR